MVRRRLLANVGLAALLGLAILSSVGASVASACPNCKEAMAANDPAHNGLVKGYFYSILLMMGTPFTTLGLFSAVMYREVLKARAARNAQSALLPPTEAPAADDSGGPTPPAAN